MREILFKNKLDATKFILGSLLQSLFQISYSIAVAILIGMIPEATLPHFWSTVAYAFAFLLLLPLLQVYARLLRIKYMKDKHLELRQRVFDRIMSLDYRTFGTKSKEEYISILTNDMFAFENTFFPLSQQIISSAGIFLFSFLILLYFDLTLALLVIFLVALLYLTMMVFTKATTRMQNQALREASKVSIFSGNTLSGLELLKLNRIEDRFLKLNLSKMDKMEAKKMKLNVFVLTQKMLTKFIGSLIFITIIFYVGKRMIVGGDLTETALLVGLANNMVWPVTEILPLVNQVIAVTDSMRRHINLRADSYLEGKEDFKLEDRIRVENLSFRYGVREVIKDASFEIIPGKKYLVKGPSGSGKSTMLKILAKANFDYKGKVYFDDLELSNISDASHSLNTAFIYQDVFLLEDSLRNNLTLYKDIPEEKIMDAVRASGLESFLAKHQEGLDTKIMENGKNLSGGERQRISIARAILKDAKILFVDEATSSLDEKMALKIEKTLLSTNDTVLAISHKIFKETMYMYDYVMELRFGKVFIREAKEYFTEVLK